MAKKKSSKPRSRTPIDTNPFVPGTTGLPRLRHRASFVPGTSGKPWAGWFHEAKESQTLAELLLETPFEKLQTGHLREGLRRLEAGRAELLAEFPFRGRNAIEKRARESISQIDLVIQRIKLALIGRKKSSSSAPLRREDTVTSGLVAAATPQPQLPVRHRLSKVKDSDEVQPRGAAKKKSLNYRSELKRGISFGLTKNPLSTDLELCRWLDSEGAAELPTRLAVDGNRSFEAAYKRHSTKRAIEVVISKVRKDMRTLGLLS